MKFTVNNRWSGEVQFTADIECNEGASTSIKLGLAIGWAIKSGADLSGADLSRADLSGADLSGAYLSGAYLSRAYLSRADLSGADLSGANLSGADLSGANLSGAYLSGADLSGAYLSGAYLSRADLSRAALSGANLSGANLSGANLSRAYLSGANLSRAYLGNQWVVQGATRSDGYQFLLTSFTSEGVRLRAGCRNFTIEEAREHWTKTRKGTPLGDETFAIIDGMLTLARIRGLDVEATIPAAA